MTDPRLTAAVDAYDRVRRERLGNVWPLTPPERDALASLLAPAIAAYLGPLPDASLVVRVVIVGSANAPGIRFVPTPGFIEGAGEQVAGLLRERLPLLDWRGTAEIVRP